MVERQMANPRQRQKDNQNEGESGDEPPPSEAPQLRNWIVATAVSITVCALVAKRHTLPYRVDRVVGVLLVIILLAAAVWLIVQLYAMWRREQRVAGIYPPLVATVVVGLLVAVQPPEESAWHSLSCKAGFYGLGTGMVYVKLTPDPSRSNLREAYLVRISWGSKEAVRNEVIYTDTYFTFHKQDFYSPTGFNASVEPAAKLTCGNGAAPPSADRVHLTRDRWTSHADEVVKQPADDKRPSLLMAALVGVAMLNVVLGVLVGLLANWTGRPAWLSVRMVWRLLVVAVAGLVLLAIIAVLLA
jgi:hypothetical protein